MPRAPHLERQDLAAEAQAVWDHVAGTRGNVRGPYQVLLAVPPLAEQVANLGTYLRYQGLLAGVDRELAILAGAREIGSRYEWVAHEPIGSKEGVRAEVIEAIRTLGPLDSLTDRERLIVDVVRALLRERRIPDDLFARARDLFGHEQLVELVGLTGYYGLIGLTLVAFEVEPPGGERPF